MRAPASTGTNKLPTLEDNSQTSGATSQGHNSKSHNSSHQGSRDGSNNSGEGSSTTKPRGMKRSPYLSVMAGSTKESEDLVALLSRPRSNSSATQKKLDEILPSGSHGGGITEGGKEGSTGASVLMERMNVDDNDERMGRGELIGVGGVIGNKGLSHGVNLSNTNQQQSQPGSDAFFNLKRPSNKPPPQSNSSGSGGFELNRNRSTTPSVTPVSSGGTEFTNAEYDDQGSGSGSASNQGSGSGDARMKPPPQPSSNNRTFGIGPQLKSALRIGGSRSNLQETPSTSNMGRSNVSFSNTTKMASTKGLTTFPDTVDGNKYGNATFNFGTSAAGQGSVQAKQVAQMRQFQIGGGGLSSGQGMMGGAKYSAQNMMRKSQSIAAPQFMLTHTQSIGSKSGTIDSRGNSSRTNESFNIASSSGQSVATTTTGNSGGSGGSGEVVGQSFPIFLGKLSTPSDKQQQKSQQQPQQQNLQKHVRQRSQSTTTLKYYASHNQNTSCIQKDPAQQLLQAAGMTGIATTRTSTLNLTFREMLDEGDGTENDLNSRLRNQQWKDFSNFSNQFEKSNPMLRSVDEHSSTGSKDSSMGECSSASTTGAAGRRKSSMGSQMSLSGSKRSIGSGGSSGGASSGGSNPNSRGNQQWQRPYGLAGSHRQAVSVNDLAVLRRAASRMKMNNVTGGGGGMGSMGGMGVQKLPGETLGGSLLSRINSTADSSIGGSSHSGAAANTPPTTILSPMEQMMARKQSQQQTTQQQPQTSEMFMKQFNLAMSSGPGQYSVQPSPSTVYNTTSSSGASMGRQVRSVGAGLAYGRVNMTTNANRLSRFNLGNMNRTNSRLSEISSAGSSSSRTGIGTPRGNEEWDLG